jgi:hypothetical protein
MHVRRWIGFGLVVMSAALLACGGGGETPTGPQPRSPLPPPPPKHAPKANAATGSNAGAPASAAKAEQIDVDLVPTRVSPAPKAMPKVAVDVPGVDQFLPASFIQGYKVRPNIRGWDGLPEGSYLQLILDNRPYRAITDLKTPIALMDLAAEGTLGEGEHVLAAFMCRPNHESYKGPDGAAVNRFWVGKKKAPEWSSNAPMLLMNRPFGAYKGSESEDILIDWYVLNAVLSDKEYFVRINLKGPGIKPEGMQRNITEWRPYSIVSAHAGQYELTAELLDKNGNPAPGSWNTTTRTFSVEK